MCEDLYERTIFVSESGQIQCDSTSSLIESLIRFTECKFWIGEESSASMPLSNTISPLALLDVRALSAHYT